MNETPDDLRKAIERADAETEEYGASNPDYGDVDVDVCRAALSAWAADRKRIEALERAVIWAQQYFWRIGEKAAEAMMSAGLRDAQHE
ncbi:MAG TPA: hypothetical protein VI699_00315 [Candidatus Acidoferrales bacterium]|nr:hypothetical protein [Candidatus Acidoferrales bacterium]